MSSYTDLSIIFHHFPISETFMFQTTLKRAQVIQTRFVPAHLTGPQYITEKRAILTTETLNLLALHADFPVNFYLRLQTDYENFLHFHKNEKFRPFFTILISKQCLIIENPF